MCTYTRTSPHSYAASGMDLLARLEGRRKREKKASIHRSILLAPVFYLLPTYLAYLSREKTGKTPLARSDVRFACKDIREGGRPDREEGVIYSNQAYSGTCTYSYLYALLQSE